MTTATETSTTFALNTDANKIVDTGLRQDFIMIFEAISANPNGDPDAENGPRITSDSYAFATPNSLLNRVYQTAAGIYDVDIYASSENNVTTVQTGFDTHEDLIDAYWDRKLRGGLFTKTKDVKNGSIGRRGIVQVDTIESVEPVDDAQDTTIVPSFDLTKNDGKENGTMGVLSTYLMQSSKVLAPSMPC